MVSRINSGTSVEVDGIPRHVADLRRVPAISEPVDMNEVGIDGEGPQQERNKESNGEEVGEAVFDVAASRPRRVRRAPGWFEDFEMDDDDITGAYDEEND